MIASVTYNTSGSAGPYTIPFPYLSEPDIEVYLDGVANTAFTIAGTTQLTLNSAPSATVIEIRRHTQDDPYVDFTDPGGVSAENLDSATLQAIYIAQEAVDVAEERLALDSGLTFWDADSKQIKNVADPTAAQDAATKAYIDAIQIDSGNVPTPDNPGDDGKFLGASAGAFDWTALEAADLSDATATGLALITATDAAAGRTAITAANSTHTHATSDVTGVLPSGQVALNPIATQVFGG